jgi:hypothetical protein
MPMPCNLNTIGVIPSYQRITGTLNIKALPYLTYLCFQSHITIIVPLQTIKAINNEIFLPYRRQHRRGVRRTTYFLVYFILASSSLSLIISDSSQLIITLKRELFAGRKKELFAPPKIIYT